MTITPEAMFLIATMKEKGIDKETTATVSSHLKTTEQIRSMWNWINSLKTTPSTSAIYEKLIQLIEGK